MLPKLRRLAMALIAVASMAVPAIAEEGPFHVDLNQSPLYLRSGFNANWVWSSPEGSEGWHVLQPATFRPVRIKDQKLLTLPQHRFLSFEKTRDQDFTFLIPFQLGLSDLAKLQGISATDSPVIPGFNIADIGENWEIYLNGTRLRAEMHRSDTGEIIEHRTYRGVHFPFEKSLLRAGTNIVALHIVGDPTFPLTGTYLAGPYYIGPYEQIQRHNSDIMQMILIGLYLAIGLYHIFIYLNRRQDIHNLFYGLFSISLSCYLFARSHTVYQFIADSNIAFRFEYISLACIIPTVAIFLESLSGQRITRTTGIFCGVSLLFILGYIFFPMIVCRDLLRIWQVIGLSMALYYFAYRIVWTFFSTAKRHWKRNQEMAGGPGRLATYGKELLESPSGNLLIGGLLLFISAVYDILDSLFWHTNLVATQYGFFLFMMGTALILANRFNFLHRQLSGLNHTLEARLADLTSATDRLSASEQKYRSLFDGTAEPVALLNEELVFLEGNPAGRDLFGLDRGGGSERKLTEAIYVEKREGRRPIDRIELAAAALKNHTEGWEGSARFKTPIGEVKQYRLRMEYITTMDTKEILLRAFPEEKDVLAEAFVEGRELYEIESTLSAADAICRRMSANLAHYLPEEDANFLMICLREIVINAIEHGNLKISFDEKTRAQMDGTYFDLLQERQRKAPYRNRKVRIEYSVTAERATYRITDQGDGWNHRAFLAKGTEPGMLEHGRGLFMTLSAFDKVLYNDKGNQVTLVKYCQAGNQPPA